MTTDDATIAGIDGPTTDDSVERFAADLRKVRLGAGSPTLARLQSETGISRTVLSDAFAGRQLPSARTVASIVRACDGHPSEWLDRRDSLAARKDRAAGQGDDGSDRPAASSVTRRSAALIGVGGFLAGVAASVAVTLSVLPVVLQPQTAVATGARIQVENGVDPAQTPCVEDARVATGDTRADNSLLEIVWSDDCQAGWGRITRYDGLAHGNTVTIAIYPQTSPDGPDRQEATEHDVQGAYTFLVVRPSPDTLLCAEGSFTVDGKRIDLGDPLCI